MSSDANEGDVPEEFQEKVAEKIKGLDEALREEREKVAELEEEVEDHEREKLAEDIALMLAASGSIDYENVIDKRDKLASSDENLEQMKTSMSNYGPGKVNHSTVETAESDSALGPSKSAGELFPRRDGEELPPDVQQAEDDIKRILGE